MLFERCNSKCAEALLNCVATCAFSAARSLVQTTLKSRMALPGSSAGGALTAPILTPVCTTLAY